PVLAPGRADLHSLAALPSTRAIADRDVFYVARVVAAPSNSIETRSRPASSPLPIAALPSMSLLPVAPLSKTSLRVEVQGAIKFRQPQSTTAAAMFLRLTQPPLQLMYRKRLTTQRALTRTKTPGQ